MVNDDTYKLQCSDDAACSDSPHIPSDSPPPPSPADRWDMWLHLSTPFWRKERKAPDSVVTIFWCWFSVKLLPARQVAGNKHSLFFLLVSVATMSWVVRVFFLLVVRILPLHGHLFPQVFDEGCSSLVKIPEQTFHLKATSEWFNFFLQFFHGVSRQSENTETLPRSFSASWPTTLDPLLTVERLAAWRRECARNGDLCHSYISVSDRSRQLANLPGLFQGKSRKPLLHCVGVEFWQGSIGKSSQASSAPGNICRVTRSLPHVCVLLKELCCVRKSSCWQISIVLHGKSRKRSKDTEVIS